MNKLKRKTFCDNEQKLPVSVEKLLLDKYPIMCYNIYSKGKEITPMKDIKSVKTMTKKERKAYYKQFRNTWDINPVTRRERKTKWKEVRDNEKTKCN